MAAKLPGDAKTVEEFWKMLLEGRSAMTKVPTDRFNIDAFYHPNGDRLDTLNTRGGHFVRGDLSAFDAPFFSIPRTEANSLDPQQRGLLECTYHALENAGISIQDAGASKTGVFVGCFAKEYDTIFSRDPDYQPQYQASGTGSAMLSNRLSWFYDFRGPSITLDTACSSSLNALHLACQSLLIGESSTAIVGGCNVILNPETMMSLSNLQVLSPDSLCYSFDHRANGYSRGEGFAVIVLKRLSRALADNDTIRAIIRATGSNQDGKTPGITQPSELAQATLIKETYEKASLDLGVTRFFESHGTGTQIGDITEATAIHSVFGEVTSPEKPLVIGAVKSNIGHLEGASGLASIIKTVMILENGVIPPNINFERVNPQIPAKKWNIQFPLKCMDWPSSGIRRASVNSFGYGGANSHTILDDAYNFMKIRDLSGRHRTLPKPQMSDSNPEFANTYHMRPKLLVLSAKDENGPIRLAKALESHLERVKLDNPKYVEDLVYTLGSKRCQLPWKSYMVLNQPWNSLQSSWSKFTKPTRSLTTPSEVAFLFTGQGSAWYGMGRELLEEPTLRQSISVSQEHLQSLGCTWSLKEELSCDKSLSRVSYARYSQPICTALQIALSNMMDAWNILPTAVVGHSSGEIAAAYCAQALSHRDTHQRKCAIVLQVV